MTEHPMKVFILRHIIDIEHPEEPCPEDRHTPEFVEVVTESDAFADWLMKSVVIFGTAFRGPLVQCDNVFEDHYLLCLHSPWPEIHGSTFLQTKLAEGEIFVSEDHVYYAQSETLTRFDGEVLKNWYRDEHGAEIPDLDADLRRRLSRAFRYEMRSLGCNGTTIRELTPRWIAAVYKRQPAQWDWAWLLQVLKQILFDFEAEAKEKNHSWFVYEALEQDGGPDLFPPLENGELILEVIEALVDEPGESRQWLVRVQPIFGHSQVRYPEFESIRPLEKNEIFSSHRGVFWNGGSEGTWLGEIGGELLHEHHGEAIEDAEDWLREYIIESLASGIEARSGCDDFSRIVEAIDDELKQVDLFELWFHDLAPLMGRVIDELKTAT